MKLKKQILFLLMLLPFILPAQQIINGEYFIDTEPGTGNGTALPAFTAGDSITQTVNLNTTGLSVGFHRVYFRYKYNTGTWGIPEDRLFYIYNTVPPIILSQPAIVKGESFIDTDPGVGNGTALPPFTAADSVTQTVNLNTTGLSVGFHRIYYRYKDLNSKWGIPEDRLFYVYDTTQPALVNQPQITKGEYFVDTDPGVGNGTALPSFTAADSVNQTINYVTSGSFTLGSTHVIHIRFKDQNGKWGEAEPRVFDIRTCNANTFTHSPFICPGQSITVGTNTYTVNGTYTDNLASIVNGCDSTVTTNLTVLLANTCTQTLTKCAGQSVIVGNNTYIENGTYQDTLTSYNSCDSMVTTNLTVLPANSFSQTLNRCAGQSITIGTAIHNATGIFTDVLTSLVNGCDSTVTTNLTVNPLPTVAGSTNILTATPAGATYKWINCGNANAIIPNETNQSFIALFSGSYAVIVTKNGCIDTSACFIFTSVEIADNTFGNKITIYPSPAQDFLIVEGDFNGGINLIMTDITGKQVLNRNENGLSGKYLLNTESLSNGMYLLKIQGATQLVIKKVNVSH